MGRRSSKAPIPTDRGSRSKTAAVREAAAQLAAASLLERATSGPPLATAQSDRPHVPVATQGAAVCTPHRGEGVPPCMPATMAHAVLPPPVLPPPLVESLGSEGEVPARRKVPSPPPAPSGPWGGEVDTFLPPPPPPPRRTAVGGSATLSASAPAFAAQPGSTPVGSLLVPARLPTELIRLGTQSGAPPPVTPGIAPFTVGGIPQST